MLSTEIKCDDGCKNRQILICRDIPADGQDSKSNRQDDCDNAFHINQFRNPFLQGTSPPNVFYAGAAAVRQPDIWLSIISGCASVH